MAYVLENVPPLGDVRTQVYKDVRMVCQHLGEPIVLDAATLGSYARCL